MNINKVACFLVLGSSMGVVPAWGEGTVIKDKTGACQLTIPSDWKVVAGTPWIGNAPGDQGDVQLVSQPGRKVTPLNEASQKALLVKKMISNTPQSVFYSNEPTKSGNPITPYRAVAPGKDGICVALFGARSGVSEDTVTKIAATLSASK